MIKYDRLEEIADELMELTEISRYKEGMFERYSVGPYINITEIINAGKNKFHIYSIISGNDFPHEGCFFWNLSKKICKVEMNKEQIEGHERGYDVIVDMMKQDHGSENFRQLRDLVQRLMKRQTDINGKDFYQIDEGTSEEFHIYRDDELTRIVFESCQKKDTSYSLQIRPWTKLRKRENGKNRNDVKIELMDIENLEKVYKTLYPWAKRILESDGAGR